MNGRKGSLSQGGTGGLNQGVATSSSRPGARRRETSDSFSSINALTSPLNNIKQSKDEAQIFTPPPSLLRRRTDFKDSSFGSGLGERTKENSRHDDTDANSPFGSFRRTSTTGPLSAGMNGPSSPWSTAPQSAGFPPMGTFGNFTLGGGPLHSQTPVEKKLGFGNQRAESRFKGFMGKENVEELSSRLKDKSSISSLEKLIETDTERNTLTWDSVRSARSYNAEAQPFSETGARTGSAALGGDDPSPPSQHASIPYALDRQAPHDDIGFSTFGTSSDMPPFREMMQRREYAQQQTPHTRQYAVHQNEPMSPTNTNPYQSPEGEKATPDDVDTDGSDIPNAHQPGFGMSIHASRPFNANYEGTASDRSQTSSTGPIRTFPNLNNLGSLGGLGTIGGWSAAPGAVGTPSRTHPGYASGFGDSIFGSLGDIQSHGQSGNGLFGAPNSAHLTNIGTIGRGSKMGSLFPTAMQDQMRSGESSKIEQALDDPLDPQYNLGRIPANVNAPGFGVTSRDTDSSSRHGRGMLDDLFGNLDNRGRGTQGMNSMFGASEIQTSTSNQLPLSSSLPPPFSTVSTVGLNPSISTTSSNFLGRTQDQEPSSGISNQIPAAQQRQMVMPDRMRWIYRDPQGNTQGPWSGLEMHDWYKAGFFSPELQVKKLEDADYEPLAQLIRRIGNSREPFLVPQIGIPHGSANAPPISNVPSLGSIPTTSPSVQSGSAQPPFASSFPSFGTTLTAEQQNALERRKQEEQYLMARQKEHLAQQQVMIKQMHMQGGPLSLHAQQLHHHSSAHSLQSQPSYGSITSPTGYQPSPAQAPIQPPGAVPGFFDAQTRNAGPPLGSLGLGPELTGSVRDADMASHLDRLNIGRAAQSSFGGPTQHQNQPEGLSHPQQVAAMLQDRARLQREQEHFDMLRRGSLDESQGGMNRHAQFHQLRDHDGNQIQLSQGEFVEHLVSEPTSEVQVPAQGYALNFDAGLPPVQEQKLPTKPKPTEPLSLTEQVQKAASARHSPTIQSQSPWAKIETGLPPQFPPPKSMSPLPAPSAQRTRQNVADTLAAESRSRSQTPSVETPSATVAPWARDSSENSKGPSLKEIQEAEARKTAQQEEVAAAARRAIAEQERQNQVQSASPAPGLPSTSNWASGGSPVTPTSTGPSAWAKPLAGKTAVAAPVTGAKKTLAQIQKEEESRKQRLAAAAAANTTNALIGAPILPGGKRYADLAGKVASPASPAPGGAWTTVGAGGKLKTPLGTPVLAASAPRAIGGSSVVGVVATTKPKATVLSVKSNTAGGSLAGQNANEEFQKWVKSALSKGLNSNIIGM